MGLLVIRSLGQHFAYRQGVVVDIVRHVVPEYRLVIIRFQEGNHALYIIKLKHVLW